MSEELKDLTEELDKEARKLKRTLDKLKKDKKPKPIGLSCGSTPLNLAMTSTPNAAFHTGCYYLLVGASRAGKSFIGMTTLAEASINPAFDKYRLICHAPERGIRMDLKKFFGNKLAQKVEFFYPNTLEEFYYSLDDDLKAGPCICILDSMDSLNPKDDQEKYEKQKKAFRKQKEESGSYGVSKAKVNSANLRMVVNNLQKHGSIFIMISQSRDNIGFGSQFSPETRAGGRALTFYATSEVWFKVKGSIKRSVGLPSHKKDRKIGTVLEAHVKKNRDTGYEPKVQLYHYPSVGFDDLSAQIAYLIEEGKWKGSIDKQTVEATEFNFDGPWDILIDKIQSEGLEQNLQILTADLWEQIEESCRVERKSRYHS